MADRVKLGRRGEHRAAEPDGVSLHVMRHHLSLDWLRIESALAQLVAELHSSAHNSLDITLQATIKVLEHGRATGENNVLQKLGFKQTQ